jgi:hypothetical protein
VCRYSRRVVGTKERYSPSRLAGMVIRGSKIDILDMDVKSPSPGTSQMINHQVTSHGESYDRDFFCFRHLPSFDKSILIFNYWRQRTSVGFIVQWKNVCLTT